MEFVIYDDTHEAGYRRFCKAIGGESKRISFDYYESSDATVIRRHLLIDDAVDPAFVIGAVTTKEQDYVLCGETVRVAIASYPVSLGIAEPRYAMAGILVLRKLLEIYPNNFLLGMGPPGQNATSTLCRMLGWSLFPVPYVFMPLRLGPLLCKHLANHPLLARAAGLLNGLKLFSPFELLMRARQPRPATNIITQQVSQFDEELGRWWEKYSQTKCFGLVRDSGQLNSMFPKSIDAFRRFIFRRNGCVVGFAILLVPEPQQVIALMGANVVTVVDFCACADDLFESAASLACLLRTYNVDAVISNLSHGPTLEALNRVGFRSRATNVFLAISPALQARLNKEGILPEQMIISRADGDGPIGLGVDL